ncbi:MAG: ATP phosphoribosyltransferase regulatory subunit [Nitrospinae bacterium]|nr:ATP phosphoribosyltransferase regulatory subunit [Nitrospinota bacterium]
MRKNNILPKGMRYYLPEESKKKRELETIIAKTLTEKSFQEIITPMFSYANLTEGESSCDAFKFTDRTSGKIIKLRDDVTPEIAAAAASILKKEPRPLKLQYHTNIFRQISSYGSTGMEIFQSGGEVIGSAHIEADIEVLSIAIEIFTKLSLPSFNFSISSVSFFRKLLQLTGLSEEENIELKEAILRKDLSSIERVSANITDKSLKQGVLLLPKLIGKGEIFKQLENVEAFNELAQEISRLKDVYNALCKKGYEEYILVDIAEIWGYDYYTDIIFECFIPKIGTPVCTGGRYDNLLEQYGEKEPAVGFAINNSLLLNVL